ncbi:hypothetical protein ISO73_04655 [Morganella morganii subsp. morganii]|uniref:hypothetical protein n=1 Tax=Morganella morganii TaxID=582 RepID=UPI001BDA142C|nr:hypothetical protein [Morganella morganii]ELA8474994.1 hypothetical protein [Morganella morganii]MBT0449557.1 hypothetical protein [Morganella morganii subsp. morganii]MDT5426089.1 hypothetical protein [Morganella morganii]HCR3552963.1 hypothetical protein [Morganella morganii]
METKKETDRDAERIIERNRAALLEVIARICLITTSNEQDEFDLRCAMKIAKCQLTEIALYQEEDF